MVNIKVTIFIWYHFCFYYGRKYECIIIIQNFQTAAAQSINLNYIMQKALAVSLSAVGHEVHITKKVGEFLFDGYDDTLISMAQTFPKMEGVELPPFDKFGWFYKVSNSNATPRNYPYYI